MNIREVLHRTNLTGWKLIQEADDGLWWQANLHNKNFSVIASVNKYSDGNHWLHVSFALKDRMPTYDDICYFKRWLIGPDRKAIQVHAPESQHVNTHPYCLHLWSCIEGDTIPDFRIEGQI